MGSRGPCVEGSKDKGLVPRDAQTLSSARFPPRGSPHSRSCGPRRQGATLVTHKTAPQSGWDGSHPSPPVPPGIRFNSTLFPKRGWHYIESPTQHFSKTINLYGTFSHHHLVPLQPAPPSKPHPAVPVHELLFLFVQTPQPLPLAVILVSS